ncbi:hypothetical protein ACJX0J_007498, partial [Zea mays]
ISHEHDIWITSPLFFFEAKAISQIRHFLCVCAHGNLLVNHVNDENLVVKSSDGTIIESQLVEVDNVTRNLRKVYVKAYLGITTNKPPMYWLLFQASVPPMGWNSYYISRSTGSNSIRYVATMVSPRNDTVEVGPGSLKLSFSSASGQLERIFNSVSGVDLPIQQSFFWYSSNQGDIVDAQGSGAYVFRPNGTTPTIVSSSVLLSVIHGPLVHEVHQQFGPWINQITRLYKNKEHAEVEYTIGPIPIDDDVGKEVITRLTTNMVTNSTFYTDSNGRDFLKRRRGSSTAECEESTKAVAGVGHEIKRGAKPPSPTAEARRGFMKVQSGPNEAPIPESGAEGSSSRPLAEEVLGELLRVEDRLWALDVEDSSLCAAIDLVRDHLGIPRSGDSSAPTSLMTLIVGRIRELEADAFRLRVHHALVAIGPCLDDLIKQDQECLGHTNGWLRPPSASATTSGSSGREGRADDEVDTLETGDRSGCENDTGTTVRNYREDWDLEVTEPVAGNYYPVNLGVYVADGKYELSVLVDRAVGASSIQDGQLEIMLHRRVIRDDDKGVDEPLGEVVCLDGSCKGLTVRGTYYVKVDKIGHGAHWRRTYGQQVYSPYLLAFTHEDETSWKSYNVAKQSTMDENYSLPDNVAIITLQNLDDDTTLLRLAHLFQDLEDAQYSVIAKVELRRVFGKRT